MFYDNFNKLCATIGTSPTAFTRDVLGLSTSKVTAWKNGSIPKYEILQQIADSFGVSIGELFDGEPYDKRPEFSHKKTLSQYAAHIIEKESTPIKQDRSAVINRINSLTDEQFEKFAAKAEGYLDGLEDQ